MSTAAILAAGLKALQAGAPLIVKIAEWAEQGLSHDEIRKRLADPDHVGDDMLDRIHQRRERGRDLLGRDPKP
jgi:hypothetical protein